MDPVLSEFRDAILVALGDRLEELWLFGSRARGDNREESDYDLLVIAAGDRSQIRTIVAEAENQMMLRRGEILSSLVYTPETWERAQRGPLGMNIRKDGRRIL